MFEVKFYTDNDAFQDGNIRVNGIGMYTIIITRVFKQVNSKATLALLLLQSEGVW